MAEGLPLLKQDRLASYIYGPGGQILEQIAGSTASYYHDDHLGSVRAGESSAAVAHRYPAVTGVHADRYAALLG